MLVVVEGVFSSEWWMKMVVSLSHEHIIPPQYRYGVVWVIPICFMNFVCVSGEFLAKVFKIYLDITGCRITTNTLCSAILLVCVCVCVCVCDECMRQVQIWLLSFAARLASWQSIHGAQGHIWSLLKVSALLAELCRGAISPSDPCQPPNKLATGTAWLVHNLQKHKAPLHR